MGENFKWFIGTMITVLIIIGGSIVGAYKFADSRTQDVVKKEDLWRMEDNLKAEIQELNVHITRQIEKSAAENNQEGPPYLPRIDR